MDTINNKNKSNYVLSASILVAAVLVSASLLYSKGLGVPGGSGLAKVSGDAFEVKKDDVVLGDAKAPVTIFLYSDPSCPFCAAADGGNKEVMDYLKGLVPDWTPPIPGIIDNYVKTGKARLIYRYYPGHGTGEEAMKILYCANEQGKFWELHKSIAENQSVVSDAAEVKKLAAGVGLDAAKINSCLESGKYNAKLAADTELGTQAGVNGTPGFFINKMSKAGAQSFSDFKIVIDTILQNK